MRVEDFFFPAVQTVCGYRILQMGTACTSNRREAKYLDVSSSVPVAFGTVLNSIHINSWLCLTSLVLSPLVIPCFPHPDWYCEVCMKNPMYIFCD